MGEEAAGAVPEVLTLLAASRFSELRAACEDLELSPPFSTEAADAPAPAPSPEQAEHSALLCAVHLLAYLLDGDLDLARFLWKRTPAAVQSQAQAATAHRVLVAYWSRQYQELFAHLAAGPWDPRLQGLAAEVTSRVRVELLARIAKAYKVVSVAAVSAMLGLDLVAAKAACEERGWVVDADGNATPVALTSSEDLMQMGEEQLQQLAEYMAHLEQPASRI
eukprot:TRINITY_DN79644_c0_g1_i1.p1 TRINITY_DN79644_c0_g1~~TRINITY_DN79644_c0_g1_i1.p1  ORF type:complete len:221 (+),score=64.97 TRINITY_DN79644_c0_g1_i1:79-741(+)